MGYQGVCLINLPEKLTHPSPTKQHIAGGGGGAVWVVFIPRFLTIVLMDRLTGCQACHHNYVIVHVNLILPGTICQGTLAISGRYDVISINVCNAIARAR